MSGWPLVKWNAWFQRRAEPDPWDVLERALHTNGKEREGGGAREDRLRHRWRLLEIAEKTGQSVHDIEMRLGLRRRH